MTDRFDEWIGLDDPNPGDNWSPTPRQIREWGAVIRLENNERDGVTSESPFVVEAATEPQ